MDNFKTKLVFLFIFVLTTYICLIYPGIGFSEDLKEDSSRLRKIGKMYAKYKDSFPEVNDIQAKRALKLLQLSKDPVVFVDVRDRGEQEVSMLPSSVTEKDFLKDPKKYKDRTIIAYCTIGYRSGKLAQKLKKKGIEMLNLAGGILAWLHAGGNVYKDGKPVKQVHVFSRRYDLPPLVYESIR